LGREEVRGDGDSLAGIGLYWRTGPEGVFTGGIAPCAKLFADSDAFRCSHSQA
jgi:hypothetical protein